LTEFCFLAESGHYHEEGVLSCFRPSAALPLILWRPSRKYDHILISDSLLLKKTRVLDHTHSDHLPIAVEIELPEGVYLKT